MSSDYVPIGADWAISLPLTDELTGQPITSLTVTATLKTLAGAVVNVVGQGDATATLAFDATDQRYEGTIAGLRLTGLTPPDDFGNETEYDLWITEPNGKVNRRIRLPARYQGKV